MLAKSYVLMGFPMTLIELKALVVMAVVMTVSFFVHVVLNGRSARSREQKHIAIHKMWVDIFLLSLVFAVILVEVLVRKIGDRSITFLHLTHFVFVATSVILLSLMRMKYNGKEHPVLHRKFARWFLAMFFGTAITGVILFLDLAT
jgi:uncharacterized membrane protein YozB (DUF420 family)